MMRLVRIWVEGGGGGGGGGARELEDEIQINEALARRLPAKPTSKVKPFWRISISRRRARRRCGGKCGGRWGGCRQRLGRRRHRRVPRFRFRQRHDEGINFRIEYGQLLYRSVELCSHLSSRLGGHFDALCCERLGTLCFSCVCDGPLTRHESLSRTNFLVVPLPDSNVCALKD